MSGTFVKTGPIAADAFPAEAAGLTWLAAAGSSGARIVQVVVVSAERLVL
jgi:hypothetical protein